MIYVGIAETSHSKVLRRLAGNCPGSTRNACGATVQHEGAIGGPLMTIEIRQVRGKLAVEERPPGLEESCANAN